MKKYKHYKNRILSALNVNHISCKSCNKFSCHEDDFVESLRTIGSSLVLNESRWGEEEPSNAAVTKDKYSVNIPHIKDSSIMNGTVVETNSTGPFLLKNFTNSSRNPTLQVDRFGAMTIVILSLQILVVLVGSVGNAFV